ncbi:hypothetical protein GDO81_020514 [Engystomops pustulosus]|uniref:Uncharacterized protein n=1 Tax=Engystomops pustulosus TaxID=76066 RepID=A0AAV6ZGM1_ENGPU|nr:hypothetical protein GDO81_020514 [Engystomops pustulosus]
MLLLVELFLILLERLFIFSFSCEEEFLKGEISFHPLKSMLFLLVAIPGFPGLKINEEFTEEKSVGGSASEPLLELFMEVLH